MIIAIGIDVETQVARNEKDNEWEQDMLKCKGWMTCRVPPWRVRWQEN